MHGYPVLTTSVCHSEDMRTFISVIAALTVSLGLSACSSSPDNSANQPKEVEGSFSFELGLPEGVTQDKSASIGAGVDSDGNLVVVSVGSSSNPLRVTEATLEGHEIELDIDSEEGKPATMDLVPTTSTVVFPGGLPTSGTLRVELDDFGTVSVEASKGSFTWLAAE